MKILVTNNNINYPGWIKLKTLEEVCSVVGSISVLVFNDSDEEVIDCVKKINQVKKTHPKCLVLYIRDPKECDDRIRVVITGEKGKYIDDEFFLESVDELNGLIERIDEVTALSELGSVDVVKDFFQRFLKNGGAACSPAYLSHVRASVSNMVASYREKDLEVLKLSESATQLFKQAVDITSHIEKEKSALEETVMEFKESLENMKDTAPTSSMPSVLFYPPVNYYKKKDTIRIKEIGYCPFLISFMLGFRIYLERIKNIRPKLIIVEPLGKNLETKYESYKWVTKEKQNNMGNYTGPIVFTNHPTSKVMMNLLDDTSFDTFIIIDRTLNSSRHILNCQNKELFYAVGGNNDISKFKLPKKSCFTGGITIPEILFTIPVIPGFPVQDNLRENLYLSKFEKFFAMLYTYKKF